MLSDHSLKSVCETERQLRLALRAGAMGLWRIDLATSRAQWDEQVHRLQGWKLGTFPGTWEAFCSRVHPEDLPAVCEASRTCNELQRDFTVEFRVTWPDGTIHWIEDHGILDFDADGQLTGITGLSMDVTERKAAEAAMRTAREQAERASVAKSEFLSRVSHELRTPLNAILGFGQLLEMDELSSRQKEGVGHIMKGGRHLLALVNDVLDLTGIERGKVGLHLEDFEVGPLLRETVDLVGPLAQERGVRLHVDLATASTTAYCIHADRRRVKQVLLNLLSNAVKYNRPQDGEVFCDACADASATDEAPVPSRWLRLRVRDTGAGIGAAEQQRLFTPFERLGAADGPIKGTGLGLAVSKQLVEAMDGRIGVESAPGQGSTFWVEFPTAVFPAEKCG